MALDTVGILTPIDFAAEQPTVLSAVFREIFVNEYPLFARLLHVPATSETYTINSYIVRARAYTVGTGGITNVATSLPVADASVFQVGDVLEMDDGTNVEHVEVLAVPVLTTTPNTLTIRRARGGTTANAFAAAANLRLISNARTGGEVDQQAFRTVSSGLLQNVQTFQYPVQIGGKAEAISNVALPPGSNSIMGRDRAIKLVEATRDIENAFYYSKGETPVAGGDRAKMKGLKALIATYNSGANVKTGAGASYTRANFIADTMQKIYAAGGEPDTILCSTDFMSFLDTWVPGKQSIMGLGKTDMLGFPIKSFVTSLNGMPLTFVPSLQLRAGTAAVLTSSDLDIRRLREMQWIPRGVRGDAMMGDWLGDYAINLNHAYMHAWVEGITSAA